MCATNEKVVNIGAASNSPGLALNYAAAIVTANIKRIIAYARVLVRFDCN